MSRVGEDAVASPDAGPPDESLPYKVELWDEGRANVQRVIARVASAVLARAAFDAAVSEHVDRRITLRRGSRLIADSG